MIVKIGRRREKRWEASFICMTTRAIHIKSAYSFSTDPAIMALERFMVRGGIPENVYCDNRTNFGGMSNELKEVRKELDFNKLKNFPSILKIKWNFYPPRTLHMGGTWERLIRTHTIYERLIRQPIRSRQLSL